MPTRCSFRSLTLALVLAGVALAPHRLDGQAVYGTLRGSVTDSLGPAINTRVTLAGTAFAAVTDLDGRFAFHQVPAGAYLVRAEEAGRAPGEVEHVVVRSGATATVAVRLGARATAAAEGVALGDLASGTRFAGDELAALPIDDPRQALDLAPGAVMRGTDLGIAGVPDVTLRGSGADQTAVFVDGAPARFETLGIAQLALAPDAIAEMSVTTGATSAEVANARGAGIAYVTRAGGPRLEAGITGGTDGPFSRNATVGYNRFGAFAGGPAPKVRNLTWFVSGALYGQSSPYRGAGADTVPTYALAGVDTVVSYTDFTGTGYTVAVPRFAQVGGTCGTTGGDSSAQGQAIRSNYGYACQGLHEDLAWSTSRRAQAKLLYTYGAGSSVSLTGLLGDFQQRDNPGQGLADNALFTGRRTTSQLAVLNWNHRVGRLLGGSLRVVGNLSLGADSWQSGPLDLTSEGATTDPALGIELSRLRFSGLDGLALPLTDAVIRQIRRGTFMPPYYGRTDLDPSQPFRFNPYGVSGGFPTTGLAGTAAVASETRLDGRLAGAWQATPTWRVTAGVDFSRTDISYYQAPIITGIGWNAFLAHPRRTGVFAEGHADAAPFTVDVGVRADRYVTGSDFPRLPGRIFSNPAWLAGDTSYDAAIARVMQPGRTQTLVTPHARMGVALDERTTFRVGLSQDVEVPPPAMLYANVNSDLAVNNSFMPIGRDIAYVTSTLLEAGVRHAFPSSLALDASIYSKSNVMPYAFAGTNVYDPFIGGDPSQTNETLFLLQATSNASAVGGDLRLEWGAGGPVRGSAGYQIEQLHIGIAGLPSGASAQNTTTQAVSGMLVLSAPPAWGAASALGRALDGVSLALHGRLSNGLPWTQLANGGSGVIAPNEGFGGTPLEPYNSSHLPWTKALDLRIAKTARVGRTRVTAYAEARNVLNLDNLVALFAETGTDQNALFQSRTIAPQVSVLETDAEGLWTSRQVIVNGVPQTQTGVNLSDCSQYPVRAGGVGGVPDCLALRQVEARFGNGDRFYDMTEITRALTAWYDSNFGTWLFHGPARTARVGLEVAF